MKPINFGEKEFKELMIPMAFFILTVIITTCVVAVVEACM